MCATMSEADEDDVALQRRSVQHPPRVLQPEPTFHVTLMMPNHFDHCVISRVLMTKEAQKHPDVNIM